MSLLYLNFPIIMAEFMIMWPALCGCVWIFSFPWMPWTLRIWSCKPLSFSFWRCVLDFFPFSSAGTKDAISACWLWWLLLVCIFDSAMKYLWISSLRFRISWFCAEGVFRRFSYQFHTCPNWQISSCVIDVFRNFCRL